ncbi:MAG: TonB-dependent receptor, partial [Gammaproteobacteria bacterium]|nr:TonB-dependent receptor [Gammaproteobacteria bacterium]
ESNSANTLVLGPGASLAPGESISAGFLSFYLNGILTTDPFTPNFLANIEEEEIDIFAVFGRGEWDFGDNGRLSIEGRYTKEDKEVNGIASFGGPPGGLRSNDWSYFTPRVTYDYDMSENVMLYGSVAKGTKSGGFNASFSPMFPEESFYDEEENTTIEVGSKGSLLDGRLNYDVAIFHINWKDLQISGLSQDPMFFTAIVRNTGSADSKGVEVQANYAFNDWLTAGGGYAHADPTFDEGVTDLALTSVCGGLCSTDVSGKQLGRTVRNQLNLYADVNRQLSQDWDWYARADYITRSGSPTRSANLQYIKRRSLVNARIGVQNENWDIAIWGKNILDEDYVTSQIRQPTLNNFSRPTTVILGNGRQLALSIGYKFNP